MKKRKLLSLVLAGCLALPLFTGCGGDSGSGDSDTIKIGLNYELSGEVAQYGTACSDGIMMAIDEINAAGGINGKKLEGVKVDNKSDNNESMNVATRFATKDKVAAILGPATSGAFKAAIAISDQYKIPMVTCSGTANDITVNAQGKLNEWVFRTCYNDDFQGTVMGNFAATELNAKKVVILYDNTSDYSNGLSNSFETSFTSKGGSIVSKESFSSTDNDYSPVLTKIKDMDCDAIYLPAYYESVGPMIKQARALGITVPFLGADGYDSDKMLDLACSKEALNDVYFTNHYSSGDTSEEVVEFVKKFKEKYNAEPNGFNALGYDMLYYVAEAIKTAGSTDTAAIQTALASTKDFKAVTGNFSIDENHNCVKSTVIIKFVDGAQTFCDKIAG
ncbi:MAG: ABC transporter substrate-binding protein [Clostridiales bacterium]|nr:ABC transporter substrate-binding protein [Clostridiales bacterium]